MSFQLMYQERGLKIRQNLKQEIYYDP
jgi:hypothetical protein